MDFERTLEKQAMANQQDKPRSRRNPFAAEPFFFVPTKLFDCGLAAELTGAEFKRYITFLRRANYLERTSFQETLRDLGTLDGISARRAHEVHPKLEERGMILVERTTRPYTYRLLLPSEWRDRNGQAYPASRIPRSYVTRISSFAS
jgi:hypothetical protein